MMPSSRPKRVSRVAGLVLPLFMLAAAGCDQPREPIEKPVPMPGASPFRYPVALWDRNIEGETVLMVHVTEMGAVDTAYVAKTSGYGAFDSAAVLGAKALKFSPARQGELRVAVWTRMPVRFSRDTLSASGMSLPTGERR